MRRKIITLSLLCGTIFLSYAQNVGVNTNSPKVTLDVVGKLQIHLF